MLPGSSRNGDKDQGKPRCARRPSDDDHVVHEHNDLLRPAAGSVAHPAGATAQPRPRRGCRGGDRLPLRCRSGYDPRRVRRGDDLRRSGDRALPRGMAAVPRRPEHDLAGRFAVRARRGTVLADQDGRARRRVHHRADDDRPARHRHGRFGAGQYRVDAGRLVAALSAPAAAAAAAGRAVRTGRLSGVRGLAGDTAGDRSPVSRVSRERRPYRTLRPVHPAAGSLRTGPVVAGRHRSVEACRDVGNLGGHRRRPTPVVGSPRRRAVRLGPARTTVHAAPGEAEPATVAAHHDRPRPRDPRGSRGRRCGGTRCGLVHTGTDRSGRAGGDRDRTADRGVPTTWLRPARRHRPTARVRDPRVAGASDRDAQHRQPDLGPRHHGRAGPDLRGALRRRHARSAQPGPDRETGPSTSPTSSATSSSWCPTR